MTRVSEPTTAYPMLFIGGWVGVITAATAWYTSSAGVINGMSETPVLPVGNKIPLGARG